MQCIVTHTSFLESTDGLYESSASRPTPSLPTRQWFPNTPSISQFQYLRQQTPRGSCQSMGAAITDPSPGRQAVTNQTYSAVERS